ncbi:MAG: hypothetical protein ACP5P1_11375 [Acidimicrobiales bacterium]
MGAGLAVSIVALAVGAILKFALTVTPYQHGFNVHTVGVILMVVGGLGAVLSIVGIATSGYRRSRVIVDDGARQVVTQEEHRP